MIENIEISNNDEILRNNEVLLTLRDNDDNVLFSGICAYTTDIRWWRGKRYTILWELVNCLSGEDYDTLLLMVKEHQDEIFRTVKPLSA